MPSGFPRDQKFRPDECLDPFFALQQSFGKAPIQPRPGCYVQKRGKVGEVRSIGEVRPEHGFNHGVLNAFLVGQPDEPMGVEGLLTDDPIPEISNAAPLDNGRTLGALDCVGDPSSHGRKSL